MIDTPRTFRSQLMVFLFCVLAFMAVSSAWADIRQTGKDTVDRYGDAVITIETVAEHTWSYGGRQQEDEEKTESIGFVVNEAGLVIASLSDVDPSQLYQKMQSNNDDMSFTTTVKEIKYILADNTEIAAKLILRDTDLDVAVLVPDEEVTEPFTFIALEERESPEIFDEVFSISRMGRIAKRTVLGMTGEIQGVVERPRPYFITSGEVVSGGDGVPVFDSQGRVFGVVLLHTLPGGMAAASSSDVPMISVVVPTSEILNVIEQVGDEDMPSLAKREDTGE